MFAREDRRIGDLVATFGVSSSGSRRFWRLVCFVVNARAAMIPQSGYGGSDCALLCSEFGTATDRIAARIRFDMRCFCSSDHGTPPGTVGLERSAAQLPLCRQSQNCSANPESKVLHGLDDVEQNAAAPCFANALQVN